MNRAFWWIFAGALVAATPVLADVIEERQALMKRNAETMKILAPMAKGEAPFDQQAALEAFQTHLEVAEQLPDLFPEGSGEGDTRASPRIWEDMEGFLAQIEDFREDAAAAVEANPADLESFQTTFASVSENCGSCHETYRLEEEE